MEDFNDAAPEIDAANTSSEVDYEQFYRDSQTEKLWSEVSEKYPSADKQTIFELISAGTPPESVRRFAKELHKSYERGRGDVTKVAKVHAQNVFNEAKARAEAEVRAAWGQPPGASGAGADAGISIAEFSESAPSMTLSQQRRMVERLPSYKKFAGK